MASGMEFSSRTGSISVSPLALASFPKEEMIADKGPKGDGPGLPRHLGGSGRSTLDP